MMSNPHSRRADPPVLPSAQKLPDAGATAGSGHGSRRIRGSELFAGCTRVVIEHGEEQYQLRITRMGKLILTK